MFHPLYHHFGRENDPPMNFSILTTLTPLYLGTAFLGGGWGGQNFFADCSSCVGIWTWVLSNFFLVYGPPNPWRGLQIPTLGTTSPPPRIWPLACEDFGVFTLVWLLSGTSKFFQTLSFSETCLSALGFIWVIIW